MDSPPSAHHAILSALPMLRAYAVLLTGNRDRADHAVQETLVRALTRLASLQPGTNALAWLITILRNRSMSEHRTRRHEVADPDESYVKGPAEPPAQESATVFQEFRNALSRLPPDQRDALILVSASGFSYEEAAKICRCPVGTIKSRVNRARSALLRELARDHARGSKAAMAVGQRAGTAPATAALVGYRRIAGRVAQI